MRFLLPLLFLIGTISVASAVKCYDMGHNVVHCDACYSKLMNTVTEGGCAEDMSRCGDDPNGCADGDACCCNTDLCNKMPAPPPAAPAPAPPPAVPAPTPPPAAAEADQITLDAGIPAPAADTTVPPKPAEEAKPGKTPVANPEEPSNVQQQGQYQYNSATRCSLIAVFSLLVLF